MKALSPVHTTTSRGPIGKLADLFLLFRMESHLQTMQSLILGGNAAFISSATTEPFLVKGFNATSTPFASGPIILYVYSCKVTDPRPIFDPITDPGSNPNLVGSFNVTLGSAAGPEPPVFIDLTGEGGFDDVFRIQIMYNEAFPVVIDDVLVSGADMSEPVDPDPIPVEAQAPDERV